jgi:hypothetical protein
MRLEEMYHHYSNIEHQKNLPKQLQDKNKLKESEVAIEKFQRAGERIKSQTEQQSAERETVVAHRKIS